MLALKRATMSIFKWFLHTEILRGFLTILLFLICLERTQFMHVLPLHWFRPNDLNYIFTSWTLAVDFSSVQFSSVQFSSVAQSCPTLCDLMNHSMPGLPVHHQLPEFTQTHVHRVSDAIQPSHPLSSPSPLVSNPSQHQSLFQWVSSSYEVAEVLEFQL